MTHGSRFPARRVAVHTWSAVRRSPRPPPGPGWSSGRPRPGHPTQRRTSTWIAAAVTKSWCGPSSQAASLVNRIPQCLGAGARQAGRIRLSKRLRLPGPCPTSHQAALTLRDDSGPGPARARLLRSAMTFDGLATEAVDVLRRPGGRQLPRPLTGPRRSTSGPCLRPIEQLLVELSGEFGAGQDLPARPQPSVQHRQVPVQDRDQPPSQHGGYISSPRQPSHRRAACTWSPRPARALPPRRGRRRRSGPGLVRAGLDRGPPPGWTVSAHDASEDGAERDTRRTTPGPACSARRVSSPGRSGRSDPGWRRAGAKPRVVGFLRASAPIHGWLAAHVGATSWTPRAGNRRRAGPARGGPRRCFPERATRRDEGAPRSEEGRQRSWRPSASG